MVGSALVRRFSREPGVELLLRTRRELDLTEQAAVRAFLAAERPDTVIVAAAKVGGIHANNTYPAQFLYDNLAIAANCIHGAHQAGVGRLLFLGSSCIYPKLAPQPMPESCLLTGPLEPTNEAYAIAKIAGLKLAEFYRRQYGRLYHSAMPTNLYGPGDNTRPRPRGGPRSRPGARARPSASSSMSTTSPTPAPSSSAWRIRPTSSMSVRARM